LSSCLHVKFLCTLDDTVVVDSIDRAVSIVLDVFSGQLHFIAADSSVDFD